MEKFRGETVRSWILGMGPILLALTMTGCRTSPNWIQLSQSDFPAKVQAVVFENGTSLDRQHYVSWGNWKVSFGSSSPIANLADSAGTFNPLIMIDKLSCSNPVSGTVECTLGMAKFTHVSNLHCFVTAVGWTREIDIKCPTALRLE
jgi:hypothetical protein